MADFYKTENLNEIVVGGSGSAKTYRKIKVDIQQMYGSYICTDPKGELYRDTAKFLKKNGYKVRVLNCSDARFSNGYNPFAYIENESDILGIVDIFMRNSNKDSGKLDFWSGSAKELLQMVMTYLWKSKNETKSFGRALRLLSTFTFKDEKIDHNCEIAQCMKQHKIENPYCSANILWDGLQGTPQVTLGGMLKNITTPLAIWSMDEVDALMTVDEMDFNSIGSEKTAIFVIIPAMDSQYELITNIFFTQLLSCLIHSAEKKPGICHEYLVSCELDEFANIGIIPGIERLLNTCRSYNIRICIVLQSKPQIEKLYKDAWQAIIGNCSIFTYLGSDDPDTKKYIVEKLGKTTVRIESRGNSQGSTGGSSSKNESYDSRDLVSFEELPRYSAKYKKKYGGSVIAFIGGESFFMPKFDSPRHPLFGETGSKFPTGIKNNTDITVEYDGHLKPPPRYDSKVLKLFENSNQDELNELFNNEEEFKPHSDLPY